MKLYPICLKLENIACCVIGGGNIALRKVKSLVRVGAKITLVSPRLCKGLQVLEKKRMFNYKRSKYQKGFLKGKKLVIAATDNEKINKKIAADACALNILVNVVDSPSNCNFYIPSVLHSGDILMTVSTQGKFPGLAKKIKEECKSIFDKYAENLPLLARLRKEINHQFRKNPRKKKLLLEKLIQPAFLKKIDAKGSYRQKYLEDYLKKG